jgi:[acyl-carrier-protein] S-malonyltransferase
MRLPVSGAFHSALMEPAAAGLSERLDQIEISPAAFPVVANVWASPVRDPGEIRAGLEAQLTSPVRWVECVRHMVEAGCTSFVEVGPGAVLKGLLKRIAPEATCCAVGDPASLEAALETLGCTPS